MPPLIPDPEDEDEDNPEEPLHENDYGDSQIEHMQWTIDFQRLLREASIDSLPMHEDDRARLKHAPPGPPEITRDQQDSLRLWLDCRTGTGATYRSVCKTFSTRLHDAGLECDLLSEDQIERYIIEITGIAPIMDDMCTDSCLAFTGPFEKDQQCRMCGKDRYEVQEVLDSRGRPKQIKRPVKQSYTIPLGPSLQALYASDEGAEAGDYRRRRTEEVFANIARDGGVTEYTDYIDGSLYREYVTNGTIKDDDIVVVFSIDGAQLLRHRQSDCWIYIWIIYDISPEKRYKRRYVLPGGFIPGPKNMKFSDSFLFRGLQHINAIQRDGLSMWRRERGHYQSDLFVAFVEADGPGLAHINGSNGANGVHGCRVGCPCRSRRKVGSSHYYPACKRAEGPWPLGSDHDDWDPAKTPPPSVDHYKEQIRKLCTARTPAEYIKLRAETGYNKPSIWEAVHRIFPVPLCVTPDVMHLNGANLPSLLLSLWRGIFPGKKHHPDDNPADWPWAVLVGEIWKRHGLEVALAAKYLPACFGRPPRDPYYKINSGYKSWEFIIWIWGLAPGLLHEILPSPYYENFCKLVFAVRRHQCYKLSREEAQQAHAAGVEFHREYEKIYYDRKPHRLWMCRQSVHQIDHATPMVSRVGPLALVAQWSCERTIGDLGGRCKQPSKPYENFAAQGIKQCQDNALFNLLPQLAPQDQLQQIPRGAEEIENGFLLLRARERYFSYPTRAESIVIHQWLAEHNLGDCWPNPQTVMLRRWARIRTPKGEVGRSLWKEKMLRAGYKIARMIKVRSSLIFICSLTLTYLSTAQLPQLHAQNHIGSAKCSTTSGSNRVIRTSLRYTTLR
jgi:hypothetical protein